MATLCSADGSKTSSVMALNQTYSARYEIPLVEQVPNSVREPFIGHGAQFRVQGLGMEG